jgi:hypothetical protein
MRHALREIALRFLAAGLFAALAHSAFGTEKDLEFARSCVPIAEYTTHMAAVQLEDLHRLQISDVAGLRDLLERQVALDVLTLWGAVLDKRTSIENREGALRLLRLIAIQNEKFPVSVLNADSTATAILQSAIQDDPAHADLLRRKDWSKPKWMN